MRGHSTLSCSVTGYRKRTHGRPCEDATRVLHTKTATIAAVADGHGDARCLYADVGAALAVRAACEVLKEALTALPARLQKPADYWNAHRRQVAEEIVRTFSRLSVEDFAGRCRDSITETEQAELYAHIEGLFRTGTEILSPDEMRERYATRRRREERLARILHLYGTTVRASVMTDTYIFNLALGDGDTVAVAGGRTVWLLPKTSAYATETASLCAASDRAVEDFLFSYVELCPAAAPLCDISLPDPVLLLATDGLRNSFFSDELFADKVVSMAEAARRDSRRVLCRRLRSLYEALSRGSVYQDDISTVTVFRNVR